MTEKPIQPRSQGLSSSRSLEIEGGGKTRDPGNEVEADQDFKGPGAPRVNTIE